VTLALAHKGVAVESVWVDPDDRTPVREASGQDLVPILAFDDGTWVQDSIQILYWLEQHFPEPPLLPRDDSRCVELQLFLQWFDGVWKEAPNRIEAELRKDEPDKRTVGMWAHQLGYWLGMFDRLLTDRDYLYGDEFSAADCAAFPFVKYSVLGLPPGDEELFHSVLVEFQLHHGQNQRLEAWVRLVDERPRT
jgi:glutathione S-transferase